MAERPSCVQALRQRLSLGAAVAALAGLAFGCTGKQKAMEKPAPDAVLAKKPTAEKTVAGKGTGTTDNPPSDDRFQAFVRHYADDSKTFIAEWWSADLDGNGSPDRIAVLCDRPFGEEQVTLLVQSDAGVTHRVPWKIRGSQQDLCPSPDARFSACIEAYCKEAETAAATKDKAEGDKVLSACKSAQFPAPLRRKVAEACRTTPAFAAQAQGEFSPSPILARAGETSGETLRIGLREGKPVVIHAEYASLANQGGGDVLTLTADFEGLTLRENAGLYTHLIVNGRGPGHDFSSIVEGLQLAHYSAVFDKSSAQESIAIKLHIEGLSSSNLISDGVELRWGRFNSASNVPMRHVRISTDQAGKLSAVWLKPAKLALPIINGGAAAFDVRLIYDPGEKEVTPSQAQGFTAILTLPVAGARHNNVLRLVDYSGGRYPVMANTEAIDPEASTWAPLPLPKE